MIANLDALFPTKEFDANAKVTSVPWMVRDLWQSGKINVMFGPEKAGKSRLLAWILASLWQDTSVLGMQIVQSPKRALYLAGEELTTDVNARLLRYSAIQGVVEGVQLPIDFIDAAGMRLDYAQYRQWLEQKLADYELLVVDPLRRVHGADENDNSAMSLIFNDFRRWSNKMGKTIVLLHHTGKLQDGADLDRIATWGRGATDLAAILDTAQFVQRLTPTKVRLMRAGRFPPVPALELLDGFDKDFVYKVKS